MVLPAPVVLVFGSVSQRAALKDCRSAARALVAFGWPARRIRIDRKASAPSGAPLSRPNSVLGTPKNKESDFPFPMPDNSRIFSVKKVSAVNLPTLNSWQKLEANTNAGSILKFFGPPEGETGNLAGAMRGIRQEDIPKIPEEVRAAGQFGTAKRAP